MKNSFFLPEASISKFPSFDRSSHYSIRSEKNSFVEKEKFTEAILNFNQTDNKDRRNDFENHSKDLDKTLRSLEDTKQIKKKEAEKNNFNKIQDEKKIEEKAKEENKEKIASFLQDLKNLLMSLSSNNKNLNFEATKDNNLQFNSKQITQIKKLLSQLEIGLNNKNTNTNELLKNIKNIFQNLITNNTLDKNSFNKDLLNYLSGKNETPTNLNLSQLKDIVNQLQKTLSEYNSVENGKETNFSKQDFNTKNDSSPLKQDIGDVNKNLKPSNNDPALRSKMIDFAQKEEQANVQKQIVNKNSRDYISNLKSEKNQTIKDNHSQIFNKKNLTEQIQQQLFSKEIVKQNTNSEMNLFSPEINNSLQFKNTQSYLKSQMPQQQANVNQLAQHVIKSINTAIISGKKVIHLKLNPRELGEINILLKEEGNAGQ